MGTVVLNAHASVIVRFTHGIEECQRSSLEFIAMPLQRLGADTWDVPVAVINRLQAETILSVNSSWGVFSRSRIDLLPHQLWVCRKVLRSNPRRWLIADDVGLGKTIEAGMILMPLLSSGAIRRLLILAPASLVLQWQERLYSMFDIRVEVYNPDADTSTTDYWNFHNQVVASFQTLRSDHGGRQNRIFEADPWDMVIFDEAHHLSVDEKQGATLGYRLIRQLQDHGRVSSMIFFSGTPHRGKDYSFLSLLHLLRPELVNPEEPLVSQLRVLPEIVIRNNKACVTDLAGRRLFQNPVVRTQDFQYSAQEQSFYSLLSEFIRAGLAYASGLDRTQGQAVALVLIALQKLMASSFAAVRSALERRLHRIERGRTRVAALEALVSRYRSLEEIEDQDGLRVLEEQLAEITSTLQLVEDEEPRLKELLAQVEQIKSETKIQMVLDAVDGSFPRRSILFFTEYKATQALLLSALMERYGQDCVSFINGDDRLENVRFPSGDRRPLLENRNHAEAQFKTGTVRFLISTEAGGEGIDLQENCHTLIHFDLPWNPMRMHQRIGRLNRYGQTHQVEVLSFRNPGTVESLIWDKLNEKLSRIMEAFGTVMEEPEDLLQLVLGMTKPRFFDDLFTQATQVPRDRLNKWFDSRSAQFGGQDSVEVVQQLLGNVSRFDFQQCSGLIPRVDLCDLRSFLEGSLALNGRKLREDSEGLTFLTPEEWLVNPAIRREYRNMQLDRRAAAGRGCENILGVGHKVVDKALEQASRRDASLATIDAEGLANPIAAFLIRDRVTESQAAVQVMVAVEAGDWRVLKDWELLVLLNRISLKRTTYTEASPACRDSQAVREFVSSAEVALRSNLAKLDVRVVVPDIHLTAILWPQGR